jgi:hypothetical protein
VLMSGLSMYLFEIRTAVSSGRGQVPGASAILPTIRDRRFWFQGNVFEVLPPLTWAHRHFPRWDHG